jgi:hypothetical protein
VQGFGEGTCLGNSCQGVCCPGRLAGEVSPSGVCDSIVLLHDIPAAPVKTDKPKDSRKAQIDALLLQLPGVSAKKINGLDAYFVSDKMFACISGNGIGLRLPVATATELHFSRENVVAFQPAGLASSREWVQIDRAEAADYEKDLELFQASLEFVKGARSR